VPFLAWARDDQTWENFTVPWETDVKAGLYWMQAALRQPPDPGVRVLIGSRGAAVHPRFLADMPGRNGCFGRWRAMPMSSPLTEISAFIFRKGGLRSGEFTIGMLITDAAFPRKIQRPSFGQPASRHDLTRWSLKVALKCIPRVRRPVKPCESWIPCYTRYQNAIMPRCVFVGDTLGGIMHLWTHGTKP
jgi:hypothetical protein